MQFASRLAAISRTQYSIVHCAGRKVTRMVEYVEKVSVESDVVTFLEPNGLEKRGVQSPLQDTRLELIP